MEPKSIKSKIVLSQNMFTKSNTFPHNYFFFVLSTYAVGSKESVYYTLHNSTIVDKYE